MSLADINKKAMDKAIQSLPSRDRHMSTVTDMRNSKSVDGRIQFTADKLGKRDGGVNMARVITPAAPITEETNDDWDFAFAVNTRGGVLLPEGRDESHKARS